MTPDIIAALIAIGVIGGYTACYYITKPYIKGLEELLKKDKAMIANLLDLLEGRYNQRIEP